MNISLNDWILIIVSAVALFAGYGIGLLEGRGAGYKKRKAEEESEKAIKASEDRPTAPPAMPLQPIQKEAPGLLSFRVENGRLRLDLEGKPIDPETITVDQRKRLIDVVTRLRPWIEVRSTPAASAPTPAAPKPVSASSSAPSVTVAPTTRPVTVLPKKDEVMAPQSMVAQIDDILQQRLLNTPLEELGVKLEESTEGGVNVIVGGKRYSGVNEVPNPEVQAAIRAAIALWEKKFTPGL